MRKIIQIVEGNSFNVVALCDDGTVWLANTLCVIPDEMWKQLPDIPQPEKKECEHDWRTVDMLGTTQCFKCGSVATELFDINKMGRSVPSEPSNEDIKKVKIWIMNLDSLCDAKEFAKKLLEIVPDLVERIK
jgi:hypothetical protein